MSLASSRSSGLGPRRSAAMADQKVRTGSRHGTDPPQRVIAVLDLDGTITRRDTFIPFLLGFLRRHPARLWRLVSLPLAVALFKLGLRDNAWLKERFLSAVLKDAREDDIAPWTEIFIARLLAGGLRSRAREVIEEHRAAGHELVLATASLDLYVHRLAERLGFRVVICSTAERRTDDTLSGCLDGPNCHGGAKLAALRSHIGEPSEDMHVIAYSDHHADLPMLAQADRAVAVNPTRRLRAAARSDRLEIADWNR